MVIWTLESEERLDINMKITKRQLRRIIREEKAKLSRRKLNETRGQLIEILNEQINKLFIDYENHV